MVGLAEKLLEIKEFADVFRKLGADLPVQIRLDVGGRRVLHAHQAMLIAAGCVTEDLDGHFDAGFLERMDQRPGAEQMLRERNGFRVSYFFRAGTIVAQDNVAHLTSQRTVDQVIRSIMLYAIR